MGLPRPRQAGVYPGVLRDLRRAHRMQWSSWADSPADIALVIESVPGYSPPVFVNGSRHFVAITAAMLVGAIGCRDRVVEAGFWFDALTFDAPRLNGPIAAREMETIASVARAELISAFMGLRIRFTDRRDATYHVRVVEQLAGGGAGQSRAIPGFGGGGAVSFSFLATGVFAHVPPDADRESVVAAIGRGIGRTAVHEFTHQFLPATPIHASRNVRSYEYASAARREQYYGPMEWDLAWPLLQQRLGRTRP